MGSISTDDSSNNVSYETVSAPCSPGRSRGGFFFSAPTSPVRSSVRPLAVSETLEMEGDTASGASASPAGSGSDFEFSARFSEFEEGAVPADELFWNGRIRPVMLSARTDQPQVLWPLIDLEDESKEALARGDSLAPQRQGHMDEEEEEEEELQGSRGRERGQWRDKSNSRRTRSLSPLRSFSQWTPPQEEEPEPSKLEEEEDKSKASCAKKGRSGSKRWISLKDFLYRSKSEGSGRSPEKPWLLSFSSSPAKHQPSSNKASSKKQHQQEGSEKQSKAKSKNASNPNTVPIPSSGNQSHKNMNGHGARRVPVSAHELHYTANRAQAEERRRKTYLPYKHGLFGYMGFSSKSNTTMNGLARSLDAALS